MRRCFKQRRFKIMIKCRRFDSLLVQLLVSQLLEYVLASFTPFAKQPFSRHKALLTSDHVCICPQDVQSLKLDPHSDSSYCRIPIDSNVLLLLLTLILSRHGEWQTANGATKATSPWSVSLFHAALVSLASPTFWRIQPWVHFPVSFHSCWALVNWNVNHYLSSWPVHFTHCHVYQLRYGKRRAKNTFERKITQHIRTNLAALPKW